MARIVAELIINMGSRRGRAVKSILIATLEDQGFKLSHIHEVRRSQPLESILPGVIERKPKLLIAVGGDGTISDVVDHIVGHDIEIGVVPLGTTNNFARSLNLPLDIEGAVRVIKESRALPVDLGKANDDYFTNVAGIGLSALVAHHVTDTAKRRWGRFAYTVVGITHLIGHKPFMVIIEDKDRELKLNFQTHQLIIANGRFHAGKQIAVDASVDSRELLLFALGGRSKLSFIWNMLDFYIGRRKHVAHSSYLIARNIKIRTKGPQMVELDGEVKFNTPLTVSVAPRAVKVRYHP